MFIKVNQKPDHGFDEPIGLLSDCHRRIEHFLAVLLTIARHQDDGTLPDDSRGVLDQALRYFRTAAPRHTEDEEQSLFPRLRSAAHPEAAEARTVIEQLGADHRSAEARHAIVDDLGQRWLREGRLGSGQLADLRDQLEALAGMYREHIGIEDRQLFPAAARILDRGDIETIGREMAGRRGVKVAGG